MKDANTSAEQDLTEIRQAVAQGETVVFPGVDLVATTIHGKKVVFAVDMENDPIQRNHRAGRFYEQQELAMLKALFPLGGVMADIGANVGNHGLFVAHYLSPTRVIPIEPNPRAIRLLLANVAINGLADRFCLDHLGIGLSDQSEGGFAIEDRERNIGAARMLPGAGDLEVRAGDEVFVDDPPNLLKIDVEGMEMKVLSGLEATVSKARPAILIEVDRENYDAFEVWCNAHDYRVIDSHQRYRTNKNFAVLPKERVR